jgi:hypothetical protein
VFSDRELRELFLRAPFANARRRNLKIEIPYCGGVGRKFNRRRLIH